nr:retrovirus-related Pol polyprotein from transposon TNT 1-94 [Tanacetum cinerariifolium]
YELIRGRPPLIDFIKSFGCPVTILNIRDNLGKFKGKANEGYFVGYSVVSKAMRVFNKRTRIVEETLNIRFQENVPNVKGYGPNWLFDIDSLTISMNYVPVVTGYQTNGITRTKKLVAGKDEKKKELEQEYILIPFCTTGPLISQDAKDSVEDARKKAPEVDAGEASDYDGQDNQNAFSLLHVPMVTPIDDTRIFGNAYKDDVLEEEHCNLSGSGFTFLLAVASFFTSSGKLFCQWELL